MNKTEHPIKKTEIKSELWDVSKRFGLPINFLEVTDNKCIYLSNGTR